MRPVSISLDGFQGYRDPQTVDLTGVERASITGRVGAGKTSLLDAINFALFGKVRVPTKDGVIHTAAAKATTEVEFIEHGTRYRASRTLTRSGNAKAYLWRYDDETCDWVPEGDQDGRVGVTDEAIRNLIGLTWDAFRASVIVEQGRSSGFADASAPERYALLSQIVGLDRYERWATTAAEERKAVRTELVRIGARIDELRSQSTPENVAATRAQHQNALDARDRVAEQSKSIDAAIRDAEKDVDLARARLDLAQQQAHLSTAREAAEQTVTQARQRVARTATTAVAVRETAMTLDNATAAAEEARAARTSAQDAVTAATAAGEAARTRLDQATAEQTRTHEAIAVIDERLAGLRRHDNDGCFTCGQALPDDVRAKVVADLTAERDTLTTLVSDLAAQISAATNARSAAVEEFRAANKSAREAQERVDATAGPIHAAQTALEALPGAEQDARAAQEDLDRAITARDALAVTDEVDLPAAQAAWTAANSQVANLRARRDQLRAEVSTQEATIAVLADRLHTHEVNAEAIAALTATQATLQGEEVGWSRLIEAYSPAGVPRMILDTAVADINIDLDAELSALSGGALTASLDTMRTTKSGTMRSEITLTVIGQDGARVYESFSGGQRFLVDLALHLALTKTLARRNGASLDFLAIDEGWGAIEGEEREAVLRALHDVASENGALLLAITHVAEVADSFPTRIETEMISGTSVTSML